MKHAVTFSHYQMHKFRTWISTVRNLSIADTTYFCVSHIINKSHYFILLSCITENRSYICIHVKKINVSYKLISFLITTVLVVHVSRYKKSD